jgi:predicted small lipoprotein YifL
MRRLISSLVLAAVSVTFAAGCGYDSPVKKAPEAPTTPPATKTATK